jgi:hypothetical protein
MALIIWVEILESNKLEAIKGNKDQDKDKDKEEIIEIINNQLEMPTLKPPLFLLEVFHIIQQSIQLNNYSLVLVKFNPLELSLINNQEK